MSRAFVREDDGGDEALPDRVPSPHRNFVTRRGLALIDAEIARLRAAVTEAGDDRAAVARLTRDLRYLLARRTSAEPVEPPADATAAAFGTAVTLALADGRTRTFRIVGEDEADPAAGRIAWVSPVARMLLGRAVGDAVDLPAGEAEILAIDPLPEPDRPNGTP